jgi:RecA/RadA recombinase
LTVSGKATALRTLAMSAMTAELCAAGGLAVARQGDVVDATHTFRNALLYELSVQQVVQKIQQLYLQQQQIDGGCGAARELGHLAIDATPVTGIIGIEIDADRDPCGAARDDRIDIAHICTGAVVIDHAQFHSFHRIIFSHVNLMEIQIAGMERKEPRS